MTFRKMDQVHHLVYGEVYVPGVPDSQGEFMTAEEVRKAAHAFLSTASTSNCIDILHGGKIVKCEVVESFIARPGDPDFIPGAWVAGVHISDPGIWDRVMKRELNGFSLEADALAHPATLEIDLPDAVSGLTQKSEDHTHEFHVQLDDQGQITQGITDMVNGHTHSIKRGTVTDESAGHTHRYSLLDALLL